MIYLALIVFAIILILVFMRQPQFGRMATGKRLERIRQSPNYANGAFQNQSYTPNLAEGVSMFTVMKDFFFKVDKRNKPASAIPSVKTNLHKLDAAMNVMVWFGHSSYFLQVDGKKILVDPVFSGNASPLSFTTKSFAGTDVYTIDDIPYLDYLFLTHDHWDHLDYLTVLKLKSKVKRVFTGLGVGAHLNRWDYPKDRVHELDWNESIIPEKNFSITATPGRHFSGRTFKRNQSLWVSFVIKTPGMNLFLGGDSGYDSHFKTIGQQYGPFDVAILECGQYNAYWKAIHMMPEEVVQAAIDLRANKFIPVHYGKFSLAMHAWDEPISRVTAEAQRLHVPMLNGMIGEIIDLSAMSGTISWWKQV